MHYIENSVPFGKQTIARIKMLLPHTCRSLWIHTYIKVLIVVWFYPSIWFNLLHLMNWLVLIDLCIQLYHLKHYLLVDGTYWLSRYILMLGDPVWCCRSMVLVVQGLLVSRESVCLHEFTSGFIHSVMGRATPEHRGIAELCTNLSQIERGDKM